jgi:hypothetical protein
MIGRRSRTSPRRRARVDTPHSQSKVGGSGVTNLVGTSPDGLASNFLPQLSAKRCGRGGDQMALLARMLCRWFGCPAPGPERQQRSADKATASPPDESSSDDLTAIRGIGIATQNRLYRAGIKSYGQLARASPAEAREILGKFAGGASVEKWIARAKQLAKEGQS